MLGETTVPYNNHLSGGGVPNVMKEIVYVKSVSKIDRMHHRFLTKKRNWLVRQIDPSKRYLYILRNEGKDEGAEEDGDEVMELTHESALEEGRQDGALIDVDSSQEPRPDGDEDHDQ